MSKQSNLPLYRVNFCPVIGTDAKGQDQLGNSVQIGAVWESKQAGKGAILKFDIIPKNLDRGVLFLNPVTNTDGGYA